MTYAEKLKDPRWQKKRLEILSDRDWACEACKNKELTLNVHHRAYSSGRQPWEYENMNYVVLCDDCHKSEHETREESTRLVIGEMKHIFLSAEMFDLACLLFALSATYGEGTNKIITEELGGIPH